MTGSAGLLARFALYRDRLKAGGAARKLFEPDPQGNLSVFSIDGLPHDIVREIGRDVATRHPNARRLYGWAEIGKADVESVGLSVDRDDNPPRHANVTGWPERREDRKEKANLLKNLCRPVRLDTPVDANA